MINKKKLAKFVIDSINLSHDDKYSIEFTEILINFIYDKYEYRFQRIEYKNFIEFIFYTFAYARHFKNMICNYQPIIESHEEIYDNILDLYKEIKCIEDDIKEEETD